MKKLLQFLTLMALFCVPWVAQAQLELTVAQGTSNHQYVPFYGFYADANQHNQMLYPASEVGLMSGGTITQMVFYIDQSADNGSNTGASIMGTWTVSLGETSETSLSGLNSSASLTEVYQGYFDCSTGTLTIEFSNGYVYGGGNLLVDIDHAAAGYNKWYFLGVSAPGASYTYGSQRDFLPQTTFTYTPAGSGPTCARPGAITASNITTDAATISWTAGGDETSWNVYLDGVMQGSTSTPTYTFNGLSSNTTYPVSVTAVCGTEESFPRNASIKTAIGIPFLEEFAATSIPSGWATYTGQLSQILAGAASLSSGSGWNFGSNNGLNDNHARINIYGTSCYRWLVSPEVNLNATTAQLTFELAYTAYSGANPANQTGTDDKFVVLVSNNNGTTWNPIAYWTNDGAGDYVLNDLPHNTFAEYTINISELAGQTVRFAFYGESSASNADNNLHLDNVYVGTVSDCPRPSTITVENITGHTSTINWAAGGSETSWKVYLNNEYVATVNTPTYTFTGLNGVTTYTAAVSAICGGNESEKREASFTTDVTCPVPTQFAATLTPGNGTVALLSWTPGGEETEWQLCLNGDETNLITVTSNSYSLTGLTPEQTYTAKVRANCGSVDGVSEWSNTINFTPTNAFVLTVNDGTATNGYVPIYGYYVDGNIVSQFIYPAEQLSPIIYGNITSLTFYCSNETSNWNNAQFEVYVSEVDYTTFSSTNLVDWTTMTQVMNANVLSISDGLMTVQFDTPYQYMGGNLMVGIKETVSGGYSQSYWYGVGAEGASLGGNNNGSQQNFLPKTSFYFNPGEAPTCQRVTNLTVSNVTSSSATLNWVDDANTTATYTIYNGEVVVASGVNDTNYTVTGLDAMTSYTFGVVANCSASDVSSMATVNATTECAGGSCTITIAGVDSFGDGWNGNAISVLQNGEFVSTFTIANGSENTENISVCAGIPISFGWVSGMYASEASFEISNATGVIYSANGEDMSEGIFLTLDNCNAAPVMAYDTTFATACDSYEWNGTTYTESGVYTYQTSPLLTSVLDLTINYGTYNEVAVSVSGSYEWNDSVYTESGVYTYVTTGSNGCDDVSVLNLTIIPSSYATAPYSTGFETTAECEGWSFANDAQTNYWMIGSGASNGGTQSMYITNDGVNNAYTNNSASYSFAYLTFQFDAGEYAYSYDWQVNGESSYDFIRAAVVPATTNVVAGEYNGFNNSSAVPAGGIAIDGANRLNMVSTWQTKNGTFTIIEPGIYKMLFMWRNDASGGTQPPAAIDNISVVQNTCPAVVDVTVSDVTTNSAIVSWLPVGNESSWIVNVGENSYTTSDTNFSLTGLDANTGYEVSVIAVCGSDDMSFATTASFRTSCAPMSLPRTYTFEAEELMTTSNSAATPALPWCSQRYNSVAATSGLNYPYSYSSSSSAHEGSRVLYFYGSTSANYPDTSAFILPVVDVTAYPMNGNRVTFWARMSSTSYEKSIHIYTASDPTGLNAITDVDSVLVSGNTYTKYTVNLNNANAGDAYVILAVMKGSGTIYLDDLTIEEIPSCMDVANLTASEITSESVTLTWTDENNAGTYAVYGSDGVAIATVNGLSYTVTGLQPNSDYTFGVAAVCGTSQSPVSTISIHTLCGSVAMPWVENFDASVNSDPCWAGNSTVTVSDVWGGANLTLGAASAWTYASGVSNGIEAGHYRVNIYGSSCKKWLVTPVISLANAASAQLSFDAAFTAYSGTNVASGFENNASQAFMVLVSTDGGATWPEANAVKWQNESGNYTLASLASTEYINQVVNLNQYLGQNIRIAFYAQSTTSGGDNNFHIDNIAVTEVPNCLPVSDLAASGITTESVTLTWADTQNDGATYTVLNGDSVIATGIAANTYTVNGLAAQTAYTFGVVANCSAADASTMATVSATTAFEDGVCSVTINAHDSYGDGWNGCNITVTQNGNVLTTYTIESGNDGSTTFIVPAGNEAVFVWNTGSYANEASFSIVNNSGVTLFSTDDASSLVSGDPFLSIIDCHLNNVTYDTVFMTACDSYEWNGTTYTESGEYTHQTVSTHTTLFLTINQSASAEISLSGIDSVNWQGETFTEGGTYTYTYEAANGCDSVVTVYVSIEHTLDITCGNGEAVQVANADSSNAPSFHIPGESYYNYSYSEVIVPSAQLQGIGTIKAMQFKPASTSAGDYFNNCEVYMANTTVSDLSNAFVQDNNNFQLVWSGNMSYSNTDWQTLMFSDPFIWDGQSNIVVAVRRNHGSYASGASFEGYNDTAQLGRYIYQDNEAFTIGSITGGTATNTVPLYRFMGCPSGEAICYRPTDVTATNVTAESVTITWNDTLNTGATYTVYNGDAVVATGITANSYTFTGLTAMTAYTFGVVANCSAADASTMATVTVTTDCANGSCTITIAGTDSYGDGWNGNAINVLQNGEIVSTFTIASGSENTENISVCAGIPISFGWVSGMYASEANFEISNATGVIYSANGENMSEGIFLTLDNCNAAPVMAYDTTFATACDSYEWYDSIYTESGVYTHQTSPLLTSVLDLTINYNIYIEETVSVSGSYEWYGTTLTQSDVYTYTVPSSNGCDSVFVLNLTIIPSSYATAPYSTGFETTAECEGWSFANDAQTNYWMIGSGASNGGTQAMYITNDGVNNAYTNNSASYSFAYLTFQFDAGEYAYSYDWQANGESSYDFIRAAVVPATTNVVAGEYNGFNNSSAVPAGGIAIDGANRLNMVNSWQTRTGTFTIIEPGLYKMLFMWRNDASAGTQPPAAIDNISVVQNTCPAVIDVTVSDITTNSAIVSWLPVGNESSWIVNVGENSYTTSDTNISLTGLEANTGYEVSVIAVCGSDDISFATTASFRTSCVPMSLPLTYTFEAEELMTTSNSVETPALPWCSQRYNSVAATSGLTYPYSYSSASYAHNGSRSLYFYGSTSASYPDTSAFILPVVDVTAYPMNGNRVTFWARMSSASYQKNIHVYTASDPTGLNAITEIDSVLISGTTHTKYTVNLSNANAGDAYVILAVMKGSGTIYLDDLTIEEIPSCMDVANLTASEITSESVTLTWTDENNAGTYVVYSSDGVAIATVNGLSYTVTGLQPNSDYTFGVAAVCGTSQSPVSTISIHTLCGSVAMPWVENFDASVNSDPCWAGNNTVTASDVWGSANLTLGAASAWTYASSVSNGIEAGHYRVNIYGSSCKKWLVTPVISLANAASAQLSFDAAFTTYSGTSAASGFENNASQAFMVLVSTDDGATWPEANAVKWQNDGGNYTLASLSSTEYINQVINLNQYLGQNIRIAFYAQSTTSGGDNNLHIDNIAVTEVPNCLPVSDLAASGITSESVTLTWSDTQNDGATYTVLNGDSVIATGIAANTYTVNGLDAATAYTFGVVANCSAADASAMATVSATTDCANGSCTITIAGADSYGDGWNGNAINVIQNGVVVSTFTLPADSANTEDITVCSGTPISFSWVTGSYANETSFEISTVNGVVYSDAGSNMTEGIFLTIDNCDAAQDIIYDTTFTTACDSYVWNGTVYTESGVYINEVDDLHADVLVLTINYSSSSNQTVTACDSYEWNGQTYTSSNNGITFLTTTAAGCDSVAVLDLTVNYSSAGDTSASVCGAFNWYEYANMNATQNVTHTFVAGNSNGCDSVVTLHLVVNNCSSTYATACDSYNWNGYNITSSGVYVNDNDTLYLTINPSTRGDIFASACGSYDWYEHTNLTTNQDVTHTFVDANGCDSVVTLHLMIKNCSSVSVTACDSYTWNGNTYYSSGTYRNGSDTLHLTIAHATYGDTMASACGSFSWYEHPLLSETQSVAHTFVGGNVSGCDSIVTLHLAIRNCNVIDTTACDSFTWNGFTFTSSGTYYYGIDTLHLTINHSNTGDTLALANGSFDWYEYTGLNTTQSVSHTFVGGNAYGCDSVLTLHLLIGAPLSKSVTVDTVVACDSYTWKGVFTFTNSGYYPAGNEALLLTILHGSTGDTMATVCNSFDWYEHTGITTSQSLVHTFVGGNQYGCDSTVTLHLNIISGSTTVASACENYTWHGFTFTSNGTYYDGFDTLMLTINHASIGDTTAEVCGSFDWYENTNMTASQVASHTFVGGNQFGCDSTVMLHLTILNCGTTEVTACDSYVWNGYTITSSGVYVNDHDTLNLTINPSMTSDTMVSVCGGFDWYEHVGMTTSQTVNHVFVGGAPNGCDNTMTLHLNVLQCSTTEVSACNSYTWNGNTYTSSGVYTVGNDTLILTINLPTTGDTMVAVCGSFSWYEHANMTASGNVNHTFVNGNANGCDSVVTLHLTIYQCSTTDVEACDSYTWHGTLYNTTGTYIDGTDTLNLTIKNSTNSVETVTACDSYTWHGTAYTASNNTATYTTTNAAGCDSVVTLNLTINNSANSVETVSACDSYTWHGTTYTTSNNTATYTTTTTAGCDSVVTLNLTINTASTGVETVTACDSYTWHGTTYTTSNNTATYTTTNAAGCDSVVTLNLTINTASTGVETVTACDSYTWHGTTYTTSNNTATYTTTNAAGCDSVVTLNLTINNSTSATETVTACDSYSWNDSLYTESGEYTYTTTNAAGCDSVVTLNLTINNSTSATETMTVCDSYDWNGATYTESGEYTYTTTNAAGCDSVVTLNLTVNYSAETTVEMTADGSYEWNGTNYTESGSYTWTGSTAQGCDSVVTLVLTINPLGIEGEGMEVSVSIYPNPTRGMVNIEADGIEKVEVYDLNGRKLESYDATNRINLQGMAAGTYMLRVYTTRGTVVKRVILK